MTSLDIGHAKQLEHDIRQGFTENPREVYASAVDPTGTSDEAHHSRRRIPAVPDLRFEYSYLRSVRAYVHIERLEASGHRDEKGKGVARDDETLALLEPREVVTVQWGKIIWITMRDQVISPLLQGAVWGVAGHFLRPAIQVVRTRVRAWWARGAIYNPNGVKHEGSGVGWLRHWVGGFASGGVKTNLVR